MQQRGILGVLQTLEKLHLLAPADAQQLQASYRFLRKVENHIQQYQDKQTHDLPKDPLAQAILAYAMHYPDWSTFKTALDGIRQQVQMVFDQVFAISKQAVKPSSGLNVWLAQADTASLMQQLAALGFQDPDATWEWLQQFKKSPAIKRLTAKGAAVLDRLMPQVLMSLQAIENPDLTLKRLLALFEAVGDKPFICLCWKKIPTH